MALSTPASSVASRIDATLHSAQRAVADVGATAQEVLDHLNLTSGQPEPPPFGRAVLGEPDPPVGRAALLSRSVHAESVSDRLAHLKRSLLDTPDAPPSPSSRALVG